MFKAGDKVVCVDASGTDGRLTKGNVYTFVSMSSFEEECVIEEDSASWMLPRFELYEEPKQEDFNHITQEQYETLSQRLAEQVKHSLNIEDSLEQEDVVNNPKHYKGHPSGIECVQITEHMNFLLGNAMKYIWRCDLKKDAIEDLRKSIWYIEREIEKRLKEQK